jgi:hypothetical protein
MQVNRRRRNDRLQSVPDWSCCVLTIKIPVSSCYEASSRRNEAPTTMTGPLATLAEAIQRSQAALSDLDVSYEPSLSY